MICAVSKVSLCRRIAVFVAFCALCLAAVMVFKRSDGAESPYLAATDSKQSQPLLTTTLLQLLAKPEAFDQRRVRVVGVLSLDHEDRRLYLSKEFYNAFILDYSVWLRSPKGELPPQASVQGRYVVIEGVFKVEAGQAGAGVIESFVIKLLDQPGRGVRNDSSK